MFLCLLLAIFAFLAWSNIMNTRPKVGFTDSYDKHRSDQLILDLISSIECKAPTEVVLSIAATCRRLVEDPSIAQFDRLASEVSLAYKHVTTEADYYYVAQLFALFSKRENLWCDAGDRRMAAFEKFLEAEVLCRKTNDYLTDPSCPQYAERAILIHSMSRKIAQVLGELPSLDDMTFAFGPGSNVGISKNTSVRAKLNATHATATLGAARVFSRIAHQFPLWQPEIKLIRGSNWTSVPKTFKTDRGINVEPLINIFLQKGVGSVIRSRLRRTGINLNDQSANQKLAMEGSRTGKFATIDLSMASDTVSEQLVLQLLPFEWFCLMDDIRSRETLLPSGSWLLQEKFSAMGNGYTFELESLIFYSLLAVTCDGTISVYGDDLICPSECYEQVVHNLKLLGFEPNLTKSFNHGPFRESCGKDYFLGTEVRPVFLKSDVSVKEIFRLHNAFKRNGRVDVQHLVDYIPSRYRIYGPDGVGDGHLLSFDCEVKYDKRGWLPFIPFKTFIAQPRTNLKPGPRDLAAIVYHAGSQSSTDILDSPSGSPYSESMWNERTLGSPRYRLVRSRTPAGV